MIIEYEEALVKYLVKMDPSITEIQYSAQWNTMYELSKSVVYPVCLIERSFDPNVFLMKSYDVEDDKSGRVVKMWVGTIQYKVRVFLEKIVQAVPYILKLRSWVEDNPYVIAVLKPNTPDQIEVPIGMRAASVSMVEEKDGDDRQGARRAIELIFECSLPIEKEEKVTLIENIHYIITTPITPIIVTEGNSSEGETIDNTTDIFDEDMTGRPQVILGEKLDMWCPRLQTNLSTSEGERLIYTIERKDLP